MAMHAAIYARKSRESDKGESCDNQIQRGIGFCESKGLTYEIFIDDGYSGKNLDRPEFDRMHKLMQAKKFDILICYRLDRVSRSVNDFTTLYDKLQRLGVEFVSLSENFDTSTPLGRAMMVIAASFAQLERETISERIKDNMVDLFKRGQWTGGKIPYGYDSSQITIGGKRVPLLVINPEESEVIRLIYDLYLQPGASLATVARELIKRGLTDRHGLQMNTTAIGRRLNNTIYCKADKRFYNYFKNTYDLLGSADDYDGVSGLLSYGKSYMGEMKIKKAKEEWMMIPGMHEGFINSETFIAVHEKMKTQSTIAPRRGTSIYSPLTGLMICDHCGKHMVLRKGSVKGVEYKYFYCPDHMSLHTCPQKNINAKEIEEATIAHIINSVGEEGALYKKIQKSIKQLEKTICSSSGSTEHGKIETKISQIKSDISNLLDLLLRKVITEPDYKLKRDALEQEQAALEQIIKNRESFVKQAHGFKMSVDNIKSHTCNYMRLNDKGISFDEKKAIIHSIVKEIRVKDGNVEVILFIDISAFFSADINLGEPLFFSEQSHL